MLIGLLRFFDNKGTTLSGSWLWLRCRVALPWHVYFRNCTESWSLFRHLPSTNSDWSHCLAAWPDTKCLKQTLSFSSISSVRSSRLMAEISSPGRQVLYHLPRNTTKFHYRILFLWTFSTLVATANNDTQNHGNNELYNIDLSQFKSINKVSGQITLSFVGHRNGGR